MISANCSSGDGSRLVRASASAGGSCIALALAGLYIAHRALQRLDLALNLESPGGAG